MLTPTDLLSFSHQIDTNRILLLGQMTDVFNQSSNGGLLMTSGNNAGDVTTRTSLGLMSDTVIEVDINDTDNDIDSTKPTRIAEGSVKLQRSTKPIEMDQAVFDWAGQSMDQTATAIALSLAKQTVADQLNTAIGSYVAAMLTKGATVVNDITDDTTKTLNLQALLDTSFLLGDQALAGIACWIVDSIGGKELLGEALTNTANLFTIGNVTFLSDSMGRRFIITDSARLVSGVDHYALGLAPGGIVIENNPGAQTMIVPDNSKDIIKTTRKTDWSFNLGIKGFRWNEATGGASPLLAALTAGSNWTFAVSDVKDGPGVVCTHL